jgi:hypothetical protein
MSAGHRRGHAWPGAAPAASATVCRAPNVLVGACGSNRTSAASPASRERERRPVGEVVEHLAVVGDDDDCGAGALEGCGELIDQGDGRVVRRLVQQQRVGTRAQARARSSRRC